MSCSLQSLTVCFGSDELRAEVVQPESEQRWLDLGWAVKSINWSAKRLPRTANRAVQRASFPQLRPAARIKSRQRLTAASMRRGIWKITMQGVPATNALDDRSLLPRETSASPREFNSQQRQAHDRRAHEYDLPFCFVLLAIIYVIGNQCGSAADDPLGNSARCGLTAAETPSPKPLTAASSEAKGGRCWGGLAGCFGYDCERFLLGDGKLSCALLPGRHPLSIGDSMDKCFPRTFYVASKTYGSDSMLTTSILYTCRVAPTSPSIARTGPEGDESCPR
jgi:hypothetical protein